MNEISGINEEVCPDIFITFRQLRLTGFYLCYINVLMWLLDQFMFLSVWEKLRLFYLIQIAIKVIYCVSILIKI